MNFLIRQATASDADEISKLITGWACRHLEDPASREATLFLATLTPSATAERIAATSFSYYVAESPTGLSGVIALRDQSHLYHLFVHPDAQKQGVGRTLWEHAKSESSSTSFFVNSVPSAVPVYERFGFVVKDTPQSKNGLVFVRMEYGQDS